MVRHSQGLMLTVFGVSLLGLGQPLQAATLRLGNETMLQADSLCKPRDSNETRQALRQLLQPTAATAYRSSSPSEQDRMKPDADANLPMVLGLTIEDSEPSTNLLADSGCEPSDGGGGTGGGGGGGSGGGGGVLRSLPPSSQGGSGPQTFLASLPPQDPPVGDPPTDTPNQPQIQSEIEAVPLESDLAGGLALGMLGFSCYRRHRQSSQPD